MATPFIYEGTTVRFYTSTPFTSVTGTIVDPDIVTFAYQLENQSSVTYTYTNGTGDPTGTIVRDSAGTYHADISTTGLSGVWIWRWAGKPNGGADTTKTAVATEGQVNVIAKDIS